MMTAADLAARRVVALAGDQPLRVIQTQERAPSRYDHIDFTPTKAMARQAERGLKFRREHGRGGTEVGVARARDLKNRRTLSPSTVRRMLSYFQRHANDRNAEGSDSSGYWGDSENPSAGWIAWLLWGGDPGRAWARRKVRQMDEADDDAEKSKAAPEKPRADLPAWLTRSARRGMSEAERDRAWFAYIRRAQGPAERKLARRWADYLEGQAKRTADRLEQRLNRSMWGSVSRNLSPEDLRAILAEVQEAEIAADTIGVFTVRAIVQGGFAEAVRILSGLSWNPTLDPSEQLLARMIALVSETTKDRVADIIAAGLREGATINEMQSALILDAGFQPSRALRIARTESTKALNEGSALAYSEAASEGVDVRVQWLSARDSAVRPSHDALDGQEILPGGLFTIPIGFENAGDSARFPGDFNAAGEVVNCRCATLPIV